MLSRGEENLLQGIYQKYAGKLYRFLLGLSGGDEKVAEDISQEVWVSLAGKVCRIKSWDEEHLLAWLRLTARVKYRRYTKRLEGHGGIPLEEFLKKETDAGESVEDIVLLEILCREKFSELTEMEKELVRCRIYGMSYRQLHPGEKRSENALAIRCSRAFRKWRRGLQEDGLEYS